MLQAATGKIGSELWQVLDGLMSTRVYIKDTTIFEQGSPAEGVYIVEAGEVRVLLPNRHPRLLELSGPGTILGLSETMSRSNYRVTVEAHDHATVGFIPYQRFMDSLRTNREVCMQIVRILSEDLHGLYHKFRTVTAHPGRPRHRTDDVRLTRSIQPRSGPAQS